MCCLFCFSTDQQLDATACETKHRDSNTTAESSRVKILFNPAAIAHRLFKGAVEPAVVDHVLDRYGRVFQVLEGIHQDEVQDDVVEVQMPNLARRRVKHN